MKKTVIYFLSITIVLLTVYVIGSRGYSAERLNSKYGSDYTGSVPFEGMQLYYCTDGSGPPLLLIHGVASSVYTWKAWQEILSENFTVISFDLPGFGLTGPHPKQDYSPEMYMRAISHLLDQLGIEEIAVAGNSFGGLLTWQYALYDTDRVKKIVLIDAAGINTLRSDIHDPGFKLAVNPILKYVTHAVTPKFLIRRSLENAYADPSKVTDERVTRYHDMLLRKGNREAFSKILLETIHNGKDHKPAISTLNVPVLILWGEKENMIPLEKAEVYRALIKNSQLITYPDGGHIPMEEIPSKTAKDVKQFLKEDESQS